MNDYDVPETPAEFIAKVQHWQGLTILYNALKQGQRHRVKRDTQIQDALYRRLVREAEAMSKLWAATVNTQPLPGYGGAE